MAENADVDADKPSHYWCAAPDCTSDGRKKHRLDLHPWMRGVRFFPFPGEVKNPQERRRWLNHLRRPLSYQPKKYHRVCSRHFMDGRPTRENPYPTLYERNNYGVTVTRPSSAVKKRRILPAPEIHEEGTECNVAHDDSSNTSISPGLSLPICSTPLPVNFVTVESTQVEVSETQAFSEGHSVTASNDHPYTNLQREESHPELRDMSTQTNLSLKDMEKFEKDFDEMEEKINNTSKLQRDIFVENVVKNDDNVNKYTGVPSLAVLNGMFSILNSEKSVKYWSGQKSASKKSYQRTGYQKPGPARKLSRYEEFILTLVRFRLGIVAFFIGDIFGISTARVSQIFVTWMNFMHSVFSPLIKVPSRQKIMKYMPPSFKTAFPKTTAIIDCTEIYVQKPKSPTAQAQTYSTYKSSNTFKALVSITPTGAFSFVSNLWGGNSSDRYITKESGFLDTVRPGDEVMGDRGFTIRDLVTERHATLNIPPFTRKCKWGKGKRLNHEEIKRTRNIARLRIHVERAIGRMKNFKLISGVIPLKLKCVSNQMLKVAAIICNLHKPLVQ